MKKNTTQSPFYTRSSLAVLLMTLQAISLSPVIAKPRKATSSDLLAKGKKSLSQGKYDQALATFGQIGIKDTYGDFARFLEGTALREKAYVKSTSPLHSEFANLSKQALEKFFLLIRHYPDSSMLRKSIEQIALIEIELGLRQKPASIHLIETGFERLRADKKLYLVTPEILKNYATACKEAKLTSDQNLCQTWLRTFANYSPKNSPESKAIETVFPEILSVANPTFPNTKELLSYDQLSADLVAFDEGFKLILAEKFGSALDKFKEALEKFPKTRYRNRFLYWIAYAVEMDDNLATAMPLYQQVFEEYPLTWYGILSSWKINRSPLEFFPEGPKPDPSQFPTDPWATPLEQKVLARLGDLWNHSLFDLLRFELNPIKGRDNAESEYLFKLAAAQSQSGAYLASFDPLQRMIQRGDNTLANREVLKLIFPRAFESEITEVSSQNSYDPLFLWAHTKQESGFEADIFSVAGASGLLQLMPATALELNPSVRRVDLTDPRISLSLGVRYLKKMLQSFDNNTAIALAAYNAGPGNARKWVNAGISKQSMEFFVEQIPFRETREYVSGIFRNVYFYKALYSKETLTDTSLFWPKKP